METIAAFAQDISKFLNEGELTERRAFIETFVKEIVVMPGYALMRYTIPISDDNPIPGRNAEEMALNGSVLSTVKKGGHGLTEATVSDANASVEITPEDADDETPGDQVNLAVGETWPWGRG